MSDFLDLLAKDAARSIKEGYYASVAKIISSPLSLRRAILDCKDNPIISEVKFASPSKGSLGKNSSLKEMVREMEDGGAVGISILTENRNFKGHIDYISQIRGQVNIPIIMKDIILDPVQIKAAFRAGANAVLLIQALFDRGYCEEPISFMIEYSHKNGLEVLLETHTGDEFSSALDTNADMLGINNRDLRTLKVDLRVTKHILTIHDPRDRIVISESGVQNGSSIRFLRECGAKAFLVGTALMKSLNIRMKVEELVRA